MAELQRQFEGAADSIDFTDGLGSEFGVDDTTIIGKNQLDSFLFSTPTTAVDNPNDIQRADDPKPEPKTNTQNRQPQNTEKPNETAQQKVENAEQELEDASNSLSAWLTSDKK